MSVFIVIDNKFGRQIGRRCYPDKRSARRQFPSYSRYNVTPVDLVCEWFALCDQAATTTVDHPSLGAVPCCNRCAARATEAAVTPP